MSLIQTIIIAIVEGLTEFLPVSSTGHMILAQGVMGIQSDEFVRAFTVMIQLGAILSVMVLYAKRFLTDWRLYVKLIVAMLPAVVLGLLFEDQIDALLSNVWVVASMLIAGGIVMLFVDRWFAHSHKKEANYRNALIIGFYQCIAMIPGVSRSMATIVGGQQQGLDRKAAAEFSFFLAVPTMLGATLLKGYRLYESGGLDLFADHKMELIVGNLVAFVVAMLAIKFFIGFVTKYGFKLFGYYRIVAGALVLILLMVGVHLEVV